MSQIQSDDIIRRAATGVLVACIAILAVTAGVMAVPAMKSRLGWPATANTLSYAVGDKIDLPASAYESSARTLLFFAQSSCGACQRSKPAVAAIAADLARHPDIRVVMITGTTFKQDETAFARTIGIDPARLVRLDLTKLRLKRVPALVLVNGQGKVLMAKEGMPTDADRREIVSTAISGTPTTR